MKLSNFPVFEDIWWRWKRAAVTAWALRGRIDPDLHQAANYLKDRPIEEWVDRTPLELLLYYTRDKDIPTTYHIVNRYSEMRRFSDDGSDIKRALRQAVQILRWEGCL